jgi:hypothetical protein
MVTFLLAVPHLENCKNPDLTWSLLHDTLVSLSAQTDSQFQIIVVCGDLLDDFSSDSKIKNVKFLDVSEWGAVEKPTHLTKNLDKGAKYVHGLLYLREIGFSVNDFVMVVDADDFLSNKLVGYIRDNPVDSNVWAITSGYTFHRGYYEKSPRGVCLALRDDHRTFCGSSLAIRFKSYLPHITKVILSSNRNDIINLLSEKSILDYIAVHNIKRFRYGPAELIPFRAVCYQVNHGGGSISKHKGAWRNPNKINLTDEVASEFTLPTK